MVIENQTPKTETVYELKNEIPSFEEFMKSYENDGNLNYDDLNSGNVGEIKGCGPCTDGRNVNDCYCSREELLRQRNIFINTNVNIYNNIQQIINIRFPVGSIFKLKLTIENQAGYTRSKEYDSVEEAIRSAPRIVSGQDFSDEYVKDAGFWATLGTLGMVYAVPNWSASSKIRNAAATSLQSAIQNYQNGSSIKGWIRVRGRFADDPSISWSY